MNGSFPCFGGDYGSSRRIPRGPQAARSEGRVAAVGSTTPGGAVPQRTVGALLDAASFASGSG